MSKKLTVYRNGWGVSWIDHASKRAGASVFAKKDQAMRVFNTHDYPEEIQVGQRQRYDFLIKQWREAKDKARYTMPTNERIDPAITEHEGVKVGDFVLPRDQSHPKDCCWNWLRDDARRRVPLRVNGFIRGSGLNDAAVYMSLGLPTKLAADFNVNNTQTVRGWVVVSATEAAAALRTPNKFPGHPADTLIRASGVELRERLRTKNKHLTTVLGDLATAERERDAARAAHAELLQNVAAFITLGDAAQSNARKAANLLSTLRATLSEGVPQ